MHEAIEVEGKIYRGTEDLLLCDYIASMQYLMLAYKQLEEYDLISALEIHATLEEEFSGREGLYRFDWYRSIFGTKSLSAFVNKHEIEHFRERSVKEDDEVFSKYRRNVRTLLDETAYDQKYQNTRRKYSLFINEMQDIVLPYNQYVQYCGKRSLILYVSESSN